MNGIENTGVDENHLTFAGDSLDDGSVIRAIDVDACRWIARISALDYWPVNGEKR